MPVWPEHSPADVLRWLLVSIGSVTDPTLNQAWPGYTSLEPNTPDNVVTTFDVEGRDHGRHQIDGTRMEQRGVQIRFRSSTHEVGWPKAEEVKLVLDEEILQDTVTIGSSIYCVHSVMRTSDIIELGKESPSSKRTIMVINCLITLRKVS